MKPYVLVLYNELKLVFLKMRVPGFQSTGIHMLSGNTKIRCSRTANVMFGDRIISDGRTVIIVDENAELIIGQRVYFNEDAMISCKGRICIGDGCKFGPNVKLFDNNHKFDSVSGVKNEHSKGQITIGTGCWIGANSVILKGAEIGNNCVIGAGCVVAGHIPDNSIVTQGRELSIQQMRSSE